MMIIDAVAIDDDDILLMLNVATNVGDNQCGYC